MRGSKITTHSGAKHGLGGKQFQKGTVGSKSQVLEIIEGR